MQTIEELIQEQAWLSIVGDVAIGIVAILLVVSLVIVAIKALKFLKQFLSREQASEEIQDQEASVITETMRNLSQTLATIESDGSKASLLLLDAQTYTQSLVELIQAIALKAQDMAEEAEQLQEALEAIASGDPLQIAQAAGQVEDAQIRTLMLSKVRAEDFWQDTAMLISSQLGTLLQWEKGYRKFASNLLAEVSKAKAQLAASSAALELVGTSRPLLQAQTNLNEAQTYLQIQRQPGLYEAAQALPAINAGLLK